MDGEEKTLSTENGREDEEMISPAEDSSENEATLYVEDSAENDDMSLSPEICLEDGEAIPLYKGSLDNEEMTLQDDEVYSDDNSEVSEDDSPDNISDESEDRMDVESIDIESFDLELQKPKESFSYSLICFFIILAISVVTVAAVNINRSSITMVMNFPEIASGNNPDGSPFDIYDFVSDEVLEAACEKLDNRVDVNTLKAHLWVDGSTSRQSFNAVRQNILDGVENFSYFPSSYTLSYSIVSDTIKATGPINVVKAVIGQIALPSKTKILNAVAESYTEYYEEKYVNTGDSLTIDWEDTENLDHFNRVTGIRSIINRMSRYLSEQYDQDATFVSESGESFGDLSTELSIINNVDVANYESFIVQNGITSDRDRLLKQLRNVSIKNNEQYDRSVAEHNVMLEGIEMYDPNTTRVVFIPSLDGQNEFYMNRTQIGIDYLTDRAEGAKHTADDAINTVSRYDTLIDHFSSGSGNNELLLAEAEELYNGIVNKLNEFSERAIAVNNEYIDSEAYERVSIQGAGSGVGLISSGVSVVRTTVILSSLFYAMYFAYTVIKKLYARFFGTSKEGDDLYDRT